MNNLNLSELCDEALLLKMNPEDEKRIFNILYKRYHEKIFKQCKKILKKDDDVEEVAQAIELKLWENIHGFKGNASLATWIYAITYNHCIDFLRKRKKMFFVNIFDAPELQDIIDEGEDEDVKNEAITKVLSKIEQLSTIDQAIIKLRFVENKSINEIQELLNLNKSATKMRLKRALERLR